MKKQIIGLLLLGFVASLGGCGGQDEDQQVIRVTRNIGGRAGFQKHWDIWKANFENNNPGWQMELIDLGNQDGAAYYKRAIGTGDLPEVVMTWELVRSLADGGHLLPLPAAYYQRFGVDLPQPYKGNYYATQVGHQICGIAVNKRMWNEAGIHRPPPTWDALIEALDKIKAKGYKPLVLGGREWSAAMPLFYAMAANLYDPQRPPGTPSWTIRRDRGEVRFVDEPLARMIVERMIELCDRFVEKGAMSDGYNEEQRDFYNERGATWMMGCWMSGDIEPLEVNFDIEYWPIPSMTGHEPLFNLVSSAPGGWAMTTSATGKKEAKALAVLEAYYAPEVYQAFLNGEGQFSAATKVEGVDGPKSNWPPTQRLYDNMAANMAKYGTTTGFHVSLDDFPPDSFTESMKRVMQEIMVGNRDIDKLLKMLDDDWDAARKGGA